MKLINTPQIERAKQLIKKSSEKNIIVQSQDSKFNRKMLEYGHFSVLLDIIPKEKARDRPKQLDSGFNSIMGRIASKSKVALGFDSSRIKNLEKKEKALYLARLKQIIKICRKTNCSIKLLNFSNKTNAQAFMISLGSSSKQAKEAVT